MRISTKGRYALRVMLDLAERKDEGFISLSAIADRQNVSKGYLDQIMLMLNRTDFLQTARGVHGGYRLARDPSNYTVGSILRSTEGSLAPVPCLDDPARCEQEECMTREVWEGLDRVISGYVDRLTLQDVLNGEACVKETIE